MKATDLMAGDLLTFRDCQHDSVPVIFEIKEIRESELVVQFNDETEYDIINLDDEVVGVPLTPEILEKNGFEKDPESGEMIWTDGNVTEVVWCGTILTINGEHAIAEFVSCMHVHELQHALKLCGINKEIIL